MACICNTSSDRRCPVHDRPPLPAHLIWNEHTVPCWPKDVKTPKPADDAKVRHATKESGDCPHWCEACKEDEAARGAPPTLTAADIHKLDEAIDRLAEVGEGRLAVAVSKAKDALSLQGDMRAEFMAWVRDRGCDTDGAWSAWQGCWNLLQGKR